MARPARRAADDRRCTVPPRLTRKFPPSSKLTHADRALPHRRGRSRRRASSCARTRAASSWWRRTVCSGDSSRTVSSSSTRVFSSRAWVFPTSRRARPRSCVRDRETLETYLGPIAVCPPRSRVMTRASRCVHKLRHALNCPVYCLVDWNAWGLGVLLTYRLGSARLPAPG